MAPFKKKQQSVAEIVLPSKAGGDAFNSSPDHFLSHETISGYAVFKLPADVDVSHSKISLQGSIKTTTEDATAGVGSLSKNWRTEKLPFLGVVFESKAQKSFKSDDNNCVQVPFRFNLNECEKLAAFISSLPPSVNSKVEGQRPADPQYDITYSITATAYSRRGTLASAIQKVFIDQVEPDSLSDASDGEYHWAKKGMSRSRSLRPESQGPEIELAAQEPPAIVLDADAVSPHGSTEVPFIIKLSPRDGEKLSKMTVPSQCRAQASLVTKTHMTPDGIKGISSMITLDYIKVDGKTTTKVQHSHHQDHTVPITRWERSLSDSVDPFTVARFSFVFKVDGGKSPLPSFYTPLLSRTYLIDLTLSFDACDDTFKVSLPCEVVHGSAGASEYFDAKKIPSDYVPLVKTPSRPMDRRQTAP